MIFGRQKYDFLKTLVRVEMFENKLRIERKTGTVCYIIIGGKKPMVISGHFRCLMIVGIKHELA